MRCAWGWVVVATVASCTKHRSELDHRVDMQCSYLQTELQGLSNDFHKVLVSGDSNPPVLSLSTRSSDARASESSRFNRELLFCVDVRAVDPTESARVSTAFAGACDRYRASPKLEDVSAAVDQMLAELGKLNTLPLRD